MNTKVIITTVQGLVASIESNDPDVQVVVVDIDRKGEEPVYISDVLQPDFVTEPLSAGYEHGHPTENEQDIVIRETIYTTLKTNNF